jgi:nicotinamidase-related amidase
MNLKEIDIEKTALLFFDMQNGFYHEAGDAKKARANRPDLRAQLALPQVRVVPERVEHTERELIRASLPRVARSRVFGSCSLGCDGWSE